MKTSRIAMIAALVACTLVSLANADGINAKPKNIVYCTFEKAIHTPGLLVAMYQQLDDEVLSKEQPTYTLSVNYDGTLYKITGTRGQWLVFFSGKYKLLIDRKVVIFNHN